MHGRARRFAFLTLFALVIPPDMLSAEDTKYVPPPVLSGRDGSAQDLIEPLLPPKLGETVCFSGTFSEKRVELEDWSSPSQEVVPGVLQFGKPVMRPKPQTLPGQGVAALTLSLTYDDRKADYDWIYNFRLMARMKDGKVLRAAGECPWFADRHLDTERDLVPGASSRLGCYIDCDGGGFGVIRISSTPNLDFRFWGEGMGLRMSRGCGGGGSFRAGTGENDGEIPFHLSPAPASACAPLDEWAKEP